MIAAKIITAASFRAAHEAGITAARFEARKQQGVLRRLATLEKSNPRSRSSGGNVSSIIIAVLYSGTVTMTQDTFQFGIRDFVNKVRKALLRVGNAYQVRFKKVFEREAEKEAKKNIKAFLVANLKINKTIKLKIK